MTWRPRRFRLGSMRERITIEQPTTSTTNGEPNRTWSALYTDEPAQLDIVSGNETLRGRQVDSGVNAVFTIHWKPPSSSITTECRVVHAYVNGAVTDTRTYGIVSLQEVEGGRRYLEIHCKLFGEPSLSISGD